MKAVLFLMSALCVLTSVGRGAIPDNDNFATRIALVGTNVTTTGSNVGATLEPGERDPSFEGGKSVWWTWTAPADGAVTITTAGSNFDTMLAAYTGLTLANLTLVAFNDDRDETNLTSSVTFNVAAGAVYQIAVDGSIGAAGNTVLHLTLGPAQPPPANDNFANRGLITGGQANVSGSNVGATREPAEPFHAGALSFNSVWWSWTAPSSGGLTLTTEGSSIDTLLGVYIGSSISNLLFVAANEDDYLPLLSETSALSRVTFNVTAGTTYQIAVDGFEGESGAIRLNLALGSLFPPPPNDNFANRAVITGNASGSNVGASFENASADFDQGEPLHVKLGGKSVWWTWTAPSSGGLELTTTRSTFDTVLAVYTGTNLTNLVFVAGADDDPWGVGRQSGVTFNVTAGTTYQIVVDGWDGASGEIELHFRLGNPFAVPPNNNFANRILLTGSNTTVSSFNDAATLEPQEPLHNDSYGGKSVWWSWVSPAPGFVTVNTIGSRFDTTLAVYAGSALSNLIEIASDDDGVPDYTSTVTFYTKAGVTNQIAVDGYDGASGNIRLSVAFTPASYNLTVNTNPTSGGAVNVTPPPDQNGKYAPGSVVTLSASPVAAYVFSGWTGSASSINNPFSLTMNSDKTFTAGFSPAAALRLIAYSPQSPASIRTDGFRFLLSSTINSTCVLEYSPDLRNWTSLQTNQVTAGQGAEIRDLGASNAPSRFYRARRVP
jgi:uncharacterized repeat protein (TIGR02543 family)